MNNLELLTNRLDILITSQKSKVKNGKTKQCTFEAIRNADGNKIPDKLELSPQRLLFLKNLEDPLL